MYCVKVNPGRERARVRDYHSGFLPSYKPAFLDGTRNEKGVKRLVIPEYVFTLRYVPRSAPVSDDEWRIIEAISDTHPSILDPETGKISSGPLQAINDFILRVEPGCVLISAELLREQREYWLCADPPSSASSPAPADESGAEQSADDLLVENAVLKARIAEFEAKISKLQKILDELTGD